MSPSDLAGEIREYCTENASPEVVAKYARYFQDGYDAYGLTLEQLEAMVMTILEEGAGFKLVLQTSRILIRSPKYEETSFAILLTKAFEKDFTAKTFDELEFWFLFGIRNWAHCDVVSSELIYPFLKRKLIGMDRLDEWRTASSSYQRRAVPVSFIKPVKDSKVVEPYLSLIEPMMMDEAREVQQGLGWFLREAWKIDPLAVEEFLLKWKDRSPRLIFQYATEKMKAEEKKKYKREKKA